MTIPETCIAPLARIKALLTKTTHQDAWPSGRSKIAGKIACERRDINGLRSLADLLEERAADTDQPHNERDSADELAKELRQVEAALSRTLMDEARKGTTGPREDTGS